MVQYNYFFKNLFCVFPFLSKKNPFFIILLNPFKFDLFYVSIDEHEGRARYKHKEKKIHLFPYFNLNSFQHFFP